MHATAGGRWSRPTSATAPSTVDGEVNVMMSASRTAARRVSSQLGAAGAVGLDHSTSHPMAASPSGRTSRATVALAISTRPGSSGAGERLDQGLGDVAVGHQVDDDPGPLSTSAVAGPMAATRRQGRGRVP